MESAAIVLLLVLIGILLAKSLRKKPPGHRGSVHETSRPRRLAKSCPLCGSGLEPGERVRSIVYPAEGDTLAEIYGCPHCDGESATQQRTCPFCKKPVPAGGHVVARYFRRPGVNRMHVIGCTGCRSSASGMRDR